MTDKHEEKSCLLTNDNKIMENVNIKNGFSRWIQE